MPVPADLEVNDETVRDCGENAVPEDWWMVDGVLVREGRFVSYSHEDAGTTIHLAEELPWEETDVATSRLTGATTASGSDARGSLIGRTRPVPDRVELWDELLDLLPPSRQLFQAAYACLWHLLASPAMYRYRVPKALGSKVVQVAPISHEQAGDALTLLQAARFDPGSPLRAGCDDEETYARVVIWNLEEHFPILASDAEMFAALCVSLGNLSIVGLLVINAYILGGYTLNIVRTILPYLEAVVPRAEQS